MIYDFPEHIKDNSRLTITDAARELEVSTNTIRKWERNLGLKRHEWVGGRSFFYGKDLRRLWNHLIR